MIITQTGGGCRATNYIAFIRRALEKAGHPDIPVISLNMVGLEKNPGFKLTPSLIQHGLYALIFGDIFMRCLYRVRPYEAVKGSANALHQKWLERCKEFVGNEKFLSHRKFKKMCREIIRDFDNLPMTDEKKPRVGVVGEILVKFLPAANNYVVDLLEQEGAEAVVPDLTDFILYTCFNQNFKTDFLGESKKAKRVNNLIIKFFEWLRKAARDAGVDLREVSPTGKGGKILAAGLFHMDVLAAVCHHLGIFGQIYFLSFHKNRIDGGVRQNLLHGQLREAREGCHLIGKLFPFLFRQGIACHLKNLGIAEHGYENTLTVAIETCADLGNAQLFHSSILQSNCTTGKAFSLTSRS